MKRERKKRLYFEWSRQEFARRREEFNKAAKTILEEYTVMV